MRGASALTLVARARRLRAHDACVEVCDAGARFLSVCCFFKSAATGGDALFDEIDRMSRGRGRESE